MAILGTAETNGRKLIAPALSLVHLQQWQVSYGLAVLGGSQGSSVTIKMGKGAVMAACGLGPAAVAVMVNSCSCRAWPFVLSLAESSATGDGRGMQGAILCFHNGQGLEK